MPMATSYRVNRWCTQWCRCLQLSTRFGAKVHCAMCSRSEWWWGGGGGGGLGRQMQNVGRSWTQKRYKIKHAPPSDTPSAMASFINRLLTWLLWLLPANPNGPKDTMCLEKYILLVVMAILVISWLGIPCGVPLESLSAIVSWHCENQEPEGRKGSTPPPPLYKLRPCPSYSRRRDRNNCVRNFNYVRNVVRPQKTWVCRHICQIHGAMDTCNMPHARQIHSQEFEVARAQTSPQAPAKGIFKW